MKCNGHSLALLVVGAQMEGMHCSRAATACGSNGLIDESRKEPNCASQIHRQHRQGEPAIVSIEAFPAKETGPVAAAKAGISKRLKFWSNGTSR